MAEKKQQAFTPDEMREMAKRGWVHWTDFAKIQAMLLYAADQIAFLDEVMRERFTEGLERAGLGAHTEDRG